MAVRASVRVVYNDLEKVSGALRAGAVAEVARSSYEIEAIAKGLAPVRTGTLRRSIHTVFELGGLRGLVGPSVFYGYFVEFGTRHMAARPYLRPAAARVVSPFRARMSAMLKGLG